MNVWAPVGHKVAPGILFTHFTCLLHFSTYTTSSSSYPLLHTQAYQSVLKLLPVDSMEFKIYMPKGPFTMGSQAVLGKVLGIVGQDPSRALHWVLMPKPTHAHGFWVGMGSILLFMGGHGWVLFPGGYGWA